MFIKCLKVGQLETNCYIVCDKVLNRAAVIDPGFDAERIYSALKDTECEADYILLTHAHFDHFGAVREMVGKTGAKLALLEAEKNFLNDPDKNLFHSFSTAPFSAFEPDLLLKDGAALALGKLEFVFLHTPGHTPGSACILCGDSLFSGDTLFREDIGRTDLPGGSQKDMLKSVGRLGSLPGEFKIFPGHGEFTTLSHERECNPYFRGGEPAE